MARPPRALHEGIYHLAAHGSDTRYLFVNDEDREDFLRRLAAMCERFELPLLSWVLLGNHYHALLRIPDARLSPALQRLHTEYSRHHNRRHSRSAHLFRAHALTNEISSRAGNELVEFIRRGCERGGFLKERLPAEHVGHGRKSLSRGGVASTATSSRRR